MVGLSKTWKRSGVLWITCLLVLSAGGGGLCADKRKMTREEFEAARKPLLARIQEADKKIQELQKRAEEVAQEAATPNRRRSIDEIRKELESILQRIIPLQKQIRDDQDQLDRLLIEFTDGPQTVLVERGSRVEQLMYGQSPRRAAMPVLLAT